MPSDSALSLRIDLKKLLLVLGLGVPVLVVDHIYFVETGQEAYRAAAAEYLETLAATAATAAEALVDDSIARAQALAARPDVTALAERSYARHRGRDEGELAAPDKVWQTPQAGAAVDEILSHPTAVALREEIQRSPSIVQAVLADAAGPTVAASLKPTLYFQGDRTWFTVAVGDGRTGGIHVGPPHLDVPTGRMVFEAAVPVADREEGRVVGALLATVDTRSFAGLLSAALPGTTGSALLATSDGRVVAGSPSGDMEISELEALKALGDRGAEWMEVAGGRERLFGFARTSLRSRFRDADWWVVVSQDALEVNEPIRRVAARELTSAAVAILLVVILAVYFAAHRRVDVDPLHDIDAT